jgi:hypothetical protein
MEATHRVLASRQQRRQALLTCIVGLLPWTLAHADEGGTSFWLPGFFSSMAAVPLDPGLYLADTNYYYSGSASKEKQFEKGPTLAAGLSAQGAAPIFTLWWVPAGEKWFGGQPSFSMTWAPAWERVSADVTVSTMNGSKSFNVSDSQVGGTDLFPAAQINWNAGNQNWMTYLTGNIPVGAYQANRLANIGLGHSAIDVGGAYTYLNLQNGRELSAVLGWTFNAENTHTNYQSGVDMHLDWAVSQFLSNHFAVGVVGYWYQQLTPDSGTRDFVGSFKSEVAAVGGEANYLFNMLGQQAIVSVRGYWEFSAQHRPQGSALYAQIIIPLTPARNTPH